MVCWRCGSLLGAEEEVCPTCGEPAEATWDVVPSGRRRSPDPKARQSGGLTRGKVILGVVLSVMAFLIITCPDKKRHEQVLQDHIGMAVEELQDSLGMSGGLASLGQVLVNQVTKVYLGSQFSVDNYWVCSVGKVHFNHRSVMVSFGMAHRVVCFIDKDFIKKEMRRWQQRKKDNVGDILSILKNMLGFGGGEEPPAEADEQTF